MPDATAFGRADSSREDPLLHSLSDSPAASHPGQRRLVPTTSTTPFEDIVGLAGVMLGASVGLFYGAQREDAPVLVRCGPLLDAGGLDAGVVGGLCASVSEAGGPVALEDVRQVFPFSAAPDPDAAGFVAFLGVPVAGVSIPGVLAVLCREPRAWTEGDVERLSALLPPLLAAFEQGRLAEENERLAAALVHSDTRHRRLVASCPLPIYSLDGDGNFIEANQATADVLGRPIEELIGRPFQQIIDPEDASFVIAEFQNTMTGREGPGNLEFRVVRPNGEHRTVQITRAALERGGEIVGVQGIGRDVTDERSRDAQFRRVERMASVAPLLSGVCHELNNPLTSIKSFAEFLLLDERSPGDQEALEIVAREAERAAKIVSDLRVVARQSQEAASSCAMVNLNEVVEQVVAARRASLSADEIEVRLELDPALRPAWSVRPQIEQVVTHLLTNAIQAMRDSDPPRVVTVSTYPGDLGVVLQIADNGPGIRPEDQNRIFDPFWTTKLPGEGTGLGLSLVNSIVTDHGGRIRVDSGVGRGATFTIDLPATDESPVLTEVGTTQIAHRSLRVLIVDDEAPIRTSLTRYLERRGHQVQQAAEGGAALDLLEVSTNDAPFDIIVADLRMPGLDGKRFVARLRERRDGLEHRVVFITGDAESPDVEDFLREAGAPVIWKPFELAEVAQIVEAHAGMTTS